MQKARLAVAATLLTSSILSSPSWSKDQEEKKNKLETITVTATRSAQNTFDIPGMVTVIDSSDASIAGSASVKNLMRNVPGVEFTGTARRNGQNITMRGYGTDGIVVLVDGVRQKFESGHDGKTFVDPNLLKTVEIVRGPSSALYGNGGLGGVISMKTKDASDLLKPGQKLGAMVTTGYNSVNNDRMGSFSTYGNSDNVDVIANVTKRNSDKIKLGNDTKLASEDDITSSMLKVGLKPTKNQKVNLALQTYKNSAEEPNNPQDSTSTDTVDKNTQSNMARLGYEYDDPNDLLNFTGQIYHTDTFVKETALVATSSLAVGDSINRRLKTDGLVAENQTILGDKDLKSTFTYGVNAYQEEQDGVGSETGGIPDAKSTFWGSYIQNEFALKSPVGEFLIIPGVRFDSYRSKSSGGDKIDASKASPKFGTTYKPTKWLMLFGNYARAFRAPNMTETFASGTHFSIGSSSNVFVANTGLRPETSETREFGFGMKFSNLVQKNDLLKFKASRFGTKSRDFIDLDVNFTFAPCCGTSQYVNIDRAKLWGNEFEGSYENDRMIFGLNYSYIVGKNENTDDYLTNISPKTVKTNIGLKLPEINSVVGVTSRFVAKHKNVSDSDNARDGYSVHNLYYQFHPEKNDNITINLGVDNVFDKAYTRVFAGSYEPGRNYKAQVSYKW